MRKTAHGFGIAVIATLVGCGRSDTGVHIHAHVASLQYDELQFGVTRADGELVVDPSAAGLYQGPFAAGDQDVLVYLRDDLGGSQLHCAASALNAGAVVGSGAGDVTVVRGEMADVDIIMAGPGGDPGGGGAPGKQNGEPCGVGSECVTGFCAGVCCESDCGDACHSCAMADSPGLCRPVAAGTECAPAACMGAKGEMAIPASVCDGAGKCEMAAMIKCGKDATCVAGVCTEVDMPKP